AHAGGAETVGRAWQRGAGGGAADCAEDLELEERIAILRCAGGTEQPDVASGSRDGEVIGAAVAGGGSEDGGPGRRVVGDLDLIAAAVGGFPVQRHAADGGGGAQVDVDPFVVGEGAAPAGAGVAVDRICSHEGPFRR